MKRSTANGQRQTGFTLIEALVALTLLTVALVPAFLQASSALTLAGSVRNSLIAAHLAQEGVEVVRAVRDANWFANAPFDQDLDGCASGCRVQWDSNAPEVLFGGNTPLLLDAKTGLYQYVTGEPTLFSRRVAIASGGPAELIVTVTVSWRERSGDKEFATEEHLFDWLQR